jgi:signal transduction histidine kinase
VTLAVQDEGVGINAVDLPHIFEPFYRSAKARRRPGVGLGLAVVERIAAVMHGTVRAESEAGRGSRFVIRLPDATPSIMASAGAQRAEFVHAAEAKEPAGENER